MYNGYENYLTYSVALWIDNNRKESNRVKRFAKESASGLAVFANQLRDHITATLPEDTGNNVGNTFLAHCLSQVDWMGLARKYRRAEEGSPDIKPMSDRMDLIPARYREDIRERLAAQAAALARLRDDMRSEDSRLSAAVNGLIGVIGELESIRSTMEYP